VVLHQEPHVSRGVEAVATLVDLGMAVLKRQFDGSYSIVAYAERCLQQNVHLTLTLEQDGHTASYLVVPLCFGQMRSTEPRKFRLAVHSTQPLAMETAPLDAALVATTLIQRAAEHGDRTPLLKSPALGEALVLHTIDDEAGRVIVAENASFHPLRVGWEADAEGFVSSRRLLMCQDVLPPRTRQVLVVLSRDLRGKAFRLSYGFDGGGHEGGGVPAAGLHIPDIDDLGQLKALHAPQPIAGGAGGGAAGLAIPPAAPPAAPFGDAAALADLIRGFGGGTAGGGAGA